VDFLFSFKIKLSFIIFLMIKINFQLIEIYMNLSLVNQLVRVIGAYGLQPYVVPKCKKKNYIYKAK
jgi:hypothetical protein